MAFDAPEDGFVARILIEENSTHDVGVPIIVIADKKADVNAFANATFAHVAPATPTAAAPAPPAAAPAPPTAAPAVNPAATAVAVPAPTAGGDRIIASPLAKKLAAAAKVWI